MYRWKHYIFKRLLLATFNCWSSVILLIVLLDFGIQVQGLLREISWQELPLHYLAVISHRLPYVLPIGVVLSVMMVAVSMLRHGEMVALLAAGVSRWQLASPFLWIAMMGLLISLSNAQWLHPWAWSHLDRLESRQQLVAQGLEPSGFLIRIPSFPEVPPYQVYCTPSLVVVEEKKGSSELFHTWTRVHDQWERGPLKAPLPATSPQERHLEATPLYQLFMETSLLGRGAWALGFVKALQALLIPLVILWVLPSLLMYRRKIQWIGTLITGLYFLFASLTFAESLGLLTVLQVLNGSVLILPFFVIGTLLIFRFLRWSSQ